MAASGRDVGGLRAAVLTVSDGVAAGRREDVAGRLVRTGLEALGHRVQASAVVADEIPAVAGAVRGWCDGPDAVDVVVTLGGTGLGPRDVTPEATAPLLERLVPGLAEALRHEGSAHTLASYLSRGVAGLRGRTLVVNVAGSEGAARDALALFREILPHAAHILRGGGHESGEGAAARRPRGAAPAEGGRHDG